VDERVGAGAVMGAPESLAEDRVLVTGAGGLLGSAIVELLRTSPVAALAALRRSDCDLLDRDAVGKVWSLFRPTVVMHLAGRVSGVQGNLVNAGRAFYENMLINLNVIEASRISGVRKIVAAGTIAVYSDRVASPMREDDLWLGEPHRSEAAYAHAKRATLAMLESYEQQYGIPFAYLLCTNLYGPRDRFDEEYGHVVPALVKRFHDARVQGRASVTVWGDGSATRDFLHVDDAARGFLVATQRGVGAFNLATGQSVTIREIVALIRESSAFEGTVTWDRSRPSGQLIRSYDIGRMRTLGWQPVVELAEGLAGTVAWYAQNHATARQSS